MVENAATAYSAAFTPEYFVLLCTIAVLLYECRPASDVDIGQLVARFAVVAVGWVVAFAIYRRSRPSVSGLDPEGEGRTPG